MAWLVATVLLSLIPVPIHCSSGQRQTTLVRPRCSPSRRYNNSPRVAVRVVPLYEAEMLAEVETRTTEVLTVKVALVAPAGTVTLAGTLAALLLLESRTCAPPAGAGPLSVTVPVDDRKPASTLVGFSVNEDTVGSGTVTVRVAVLLVALPAELLTTTVNCAPLSAVLVAGVV